MRVESCLPIILADNDIVAAKNWVHCCFSSTETESLLGTGAQDVHLHFHTAPELCGCEKEHVRLLWTVCLSANLTEPSMYPTLTSLPRPAPFELLSCFAFTEIPHSGLKIVNTRYYSYPAFDLSSASWFGYQHCGNTGQFQVQACWP